MSEAEDKAKIKITIAKPIVGKKYSISFNQSR